MKIHFRSYIWTSYGMRTCHTHVITKTVLYLISHFWTWLKHFQLIQKMFDLHSINSSVVIGTFKSKWRNKVSVLYVFLSIVDQIFYISVNHSTSPRIDSKRRVRCFSKNVALSNLNNPPLPILFLYVIVFLDIHCLISARNYMYIF